MSMGLLEPSLGLEVSASNIAGVFPRTSPHLYLLQLQLPHQGSLRHPNEPPPDHIHSRPSYLAKVALGTALPRDCTQVTPTWA